MSFEKIRVGARVKLIGRVRTGNLLVLFSTFLRFNVYTLITLLLFRFDVLYKSTFGKFILSLSVFTLCLAALLLLCARTVKDRWYAAISEGYYMNVTDFIAGFTLRDVLNAVMCGVISSFLSLIRVFIFCSIPSVLAVLIIFLMRDGVSRAVLFILLFGFVTLTVCSVLFLTVSLGCVSLARSLCFCSTNKFMHILRSLEKNCFRLFSFSLFTGVFNRCCRRFSKIEFARFILLCDYTLL